jgi:hypothetical protein
MTDASIPLGFQTPQQQSPLASLSQIMAFKNGMAETELRRQQILQSQSLQAEQQAKADQANRDLADQGKLQELMKNPDVNARIRKGDTSDIDGVLQPKSVDALRSKQLELQNGYLTQTKEQNQIASDTIKNKIQPSVNAFYDMLKPDGSLDFDRINSSMPGIIQGLNQRPRRALSLAPRPCSSARARRGTSGAGSEDGSEQRGGD